MPHPHRRHRGPKPNRRRALELLAASPEGCTEALMLANGFPVEMLVELIRTGLASAEERGGEPAGCERASQGCITHRRAPTRLTAYWVDRAYGNRTRRRIHRRDRLCLYRPSLRSSSTIFSRR